MRLTQDQRLQGEDSLTCLLLSCGQVLADSTGARISLSLLCHSTSSHQACQASETSLTLRGLGYCQSHKESVPKGRWTVPVLAGNHQFLSTSSAQIACQGLPGKLNVGSNIWLEIYRGQVHTRGKFHASTAPTVCSPWPEVQAQHNLVFEFAGVLVFFSHGTQKLCFSHKLQMFLLYPCEETVFQPKFSLLGGLLSGTKLPLLRNNDVGLNSYGDKDWDGRIFS